MSERSEMIECIRGEIVGPARQLSKPTLATFTNGEFVDNTALRCGPLVWQPDGQTDPEEVIYFDREPPHKKYGTGLLHPGAAFMSEASPDEVALKATDKLRAESEQEDFEHHVQDGVDDGTDGAAVADAASSNTSGEFEVTSPVVYNPSTIGISFCAKLDVNGSVVIRLPRARRFTWQEDSSPAFPLNGRYESCKRRWTNQHGQPQEGPMWRRLPAVLPDSEVEIGRNELEHGKAICRDVVMPPNSALKLRVEVFPRYRRIEDAWLLTVVLRNSSTTTAHESLLYQCYFEVLTRGGTIEKYPESQRPFQQLDAEEQSLALLYRESATWGIGHGCAAGWDVGPGHSPTLVFADILPAVQLPSMTPDISDAQGNRLQLSMRELASLPDDGRGPGWQSLDTLASEYAAWIQLRRQEIAQKTDVQFEPVATRHLDACETCLNRIHAGIALLRQDTRVLRAFRLANLAMLLQQIATKQLEKRPLYWDRAQSLVVPQGDYQSPWNIYNDARESSSLGAWRAFQIAFLLMSLKGVTDGRSPDRDIVDLIWFPTGGGKTEAYLAVMAFYMFHERLLMTDGGTEPRRDGTNVLMRYTLRMLTTQQFQRAASLICAMEFLRRNPAKHGIAPSIQGQRFSLGLWIGGDGSPNKIDGAITELNQYRAGYIHGNPLIITECPWCRAEIGRFDGQRPRGHNQNLWNNARTRGISVVRNEGPLLLCTDLACCFGQDNFQHWLPVEVIDERIYRSPPSLVIGTADKLAMIAYRPDAGALFGRSINGGQPQQRAFPPGLIIQDELHLISGPLGTVYALYEGIFERLCSIRKDDDWVKPKLIASTATIRGASDQVKALYARQHTSLFPSPGLIMGDSFFGTYARDNENRLLEGRLYLGIHASDYGSFLTTQVRAFSAALFRPYAFNNDRRDPWWTLLAFYNSLRELGGAKTLFDSDIRSRLKFMFNREGVAQNNRRNLQIVEELTSRLSQSEIVGMMDRLSTPYTAAANAHVIDACLASNIIEVGVDIDRLSLMCVVGQPKTTSAYIQVTGRVGRRWWERAGLILMLYSPAKSRDRSHFEQFHSYHRRLYERVEPTSATPFALSAIQRALPGALITWARQQSNAPVQNMAAYEDAVEMAFQLLRDRCQAIQAPEDIQRSLDEMDRVRNELIRKWGLNPLDWEKYPQAVDGEYLMLWPGEFATLPQRQRGVVVPSSMRQVDGSAELGIHQGYISAVAPAAPAAPGQPSNP
jgi:hypothetical protein